MIERYTFRSSRRPRLLNFKQMLEDLCGRLASLNPAVTIQCVASGGEGEVWLTADKAIPLGLIAHELLANALQHAFPTETQGVVTLTSVADDALLRITVADDGVGLPMPPLKQGLGTAIVVGLAEKFGGALTIQSEPGRGTTVSVSVPLANDPENPITTTEIEFV